MDYPVIPIGPLGIVALFLMGFFTRGILAVLCERRRVAQGRRSIAESGWPRVLREHEKRILRNGKVNPKPAGPPPPLPVQTPRPPC